MPMLTLTRSLTFRRAGRGMGEGQKGNSDRVVRGVEWWSGGGGRVVVVVVVEW
jgi:hypothetical protein